MAREPNDGISYLMALKGNASDAASAAEPARPARESSADTRTGGTGNYQSAPA
jgi:hypothetical protein